VVAHDVDDVALLHHAGLSPVRATVAIVVAYVLSLSLDVDRVAVWWLGYSCWIIHGQHVAQSCLLLGRCSSRCAGGFGARTAATGGVFGDAGACRLAFVASGRCCLVQAGVVKKSWG
jgi:hypothetical protein